MLAHHSTLYDNGFRLVDESVLPSGRVGDINRKHYIWTRKSTGDGQIVKPTTHHVLVDEYSSKPGKYNVSYMVTQGENPYANEEFDWQVGHKAVAAKNPVSDPILAIKEHHGLVTDMMDKGGGPEFGNVSLENIHKLSPATIRHQWTPWRRDESGRGMKTRLLRSPEPTEELGFEKLNSAPEPLDLNVHRKLRGTGFEYSGRFPGEGEDIDVYHRSHPYPENPRFRVDFTIRHSPSRMAPFAYSARLIQNGVGPDGVEDKGSSISVVPDELEPIAHLDTVNKVIERHNAVKEALGIGRSKTSSVDGLDWIMDQADDDLRP